MATQMQRKKIAWPPGLLGRKKTATKSCLFRRYFFMFKLTWITEKELGRRIWLKENHENFMAAMRKWEMLAAR